MGIAHKQAYQDYLKSEHWLALRNTVIEQTRGYCTVCFGQSAMNDVHHILYPKGGWFSTTPHHLITLCRACHARVHELMAKAQPEKPADCFRQFFRIRDELRRQNPATMAIMKLNPELAEIASRRPQKPGYEWRPTRHERQEKRKSVKRFLRQLSNEQIERVEKLIRQPKISVDTAPAVR